MSEPCDGQSVAWTGFELSDSDEDHGDSYLDRVRGVFGGFFDIPDRFILADRIFDFLSPRSAGRLQNSHLCFTYLDLPPLIRGGLCWQLLQQQWQAVQLVSLGLGGSAAGDGVVEQRGHVGVAVVVGVALVARLLVAPPLARLSE